MTTVNGKLIKIDRNKDELTTFAADAETNIEYLEAFVDNIDNRLSNVETVTINELQQKLEALEKRTSREILAITIASTIGFMIIGLSLHINRNGAIANQPEITTPQVTEKIK